MEMILCCFSFLLFVTLNTTIAQSVKGILTDETDKSPIVGATVKLLNRPDSSNNQDSSTAYTTVSDKDGAFIFSSSLNHDFKCCQRERHLYHATLS